MRKTGLRGALVVSDDIVSAHNQAYDLIHALRPDAVVALQHCLDGRHTLQPPPAEPHRPSLP